MVTANDLIKQYQQAQDQANTANQQRYTQLLDMIGNLGTQVGSTYGEAMKNASTIGQTAKTQTQQNYLKNLGTADQNLISRGLGNTTIRSSVRRGIASDKNLAMQGINEQVAAQLAQILQNRAGAELGIGQLKANAIQSRNDIGPNLSTYASLIQQLAAAPSGQKTTTSVGRGLPAGSGFSSQVAAQAAAGSAPTAGGGSTYTNPAGGSSPTNMGGNIYTNPGLPNNLPQASSTTPPEAAGMFGTNSEATSGGNSVQIVASSVHAGVPIGTTKTVTIPAGMTGVQAMEAGRIPYGWKIA